MIATGSPAPDFEAVDSRGERFRLAGLRGKKVVLYFFPKAFTAGCARETRQFAEISHALADNGVEVVGISVDFAETQRRFAADCRATFPIVGDPSKAIARSYGVLSFIGVSKRVTFFIDEAGTVGDIVASALPGPHVARAKERYLGLR
ncbi:MAG: peroxiredoxin [Thermoplasmata archaeon]|nr:peroxiredoxin [Thermoplasmata archaeon]